MPNSAPEYVLGTDEIEMARLGLQHRLWADAAETLWRRANLTPGSRVLDIGCGPGFAAMDMADLTGPRGRVVGVDESPAFVAQFARQAAGHATPWASAHAGDVHELDRIVRQAGEEQPFDFAYCRWVLCFVKDPGKVLRAAARLLRPGARFCIQDYFCYASMSLAPKDPAFNAVIDQVDKSWRDRGGDPDIVGRLPGLLAEAGFRVTHLECLHRVARPNDFMWTWPTIFWESVLPRLVASGHITPAMRVAFEQAWTRVTNDPSRFCLLPPVFDLIAERV